MEIISELFNELLTRFPEGVDSVVLVEQTHYWPRWGKGRYLWVPRALPGGGGVTEPPALGRIYSVPEVIDFRVDVSDGRSVREASCIHAYLSADSEGRQRLVVHSVFRRRSSALRVRT